MNHSSIVAWLSIPLLAACGVPAAQAPSGARSAFRVRADFTVPLNDNRGWAGALNENVTVYADRPFRIRFEAQSAGGAASGRQFRLQYRRNGGVWTDVEAHDFPKPDDDGKTPRVSIVSCAAYQNGAATTGLLSGVAGPFQAGAGVFLADRTPSLRGSGAHTEWEWAIVVRRFADGAATNEEGDTFELRMADNSGAALAGSTNPLLRLAIPAGHVGGTFVETPGRIGPWRASNGDCRDHGNHLAALEQLPATFDQHQFTTNLEHQLTQAHRIR